MRHHASLYIVLGTKQCFMHVRQALYQLNHIFSPSELCNTGSVDQTRTLLLAWQTFLQLSCLPRPLVYWKALFHVCLFLIVVQVVAQYWLKEKNPRFLKIVLHMCLWCVCMYTCACAIRRPEDNFQASVPPPLSITWARGLNPVLALTTLPALQSSQWHFGSITYNFCRPLQVITYRIANNTG